MIDTAIPSTSPDLREETFTMRRTVCTAFALLLVLALAAPASAQTDNAVRFRLGLFDPDADSQYWNETFDVFTGNKGDFEDTTVGFDFSYGLSPRHALLFSGDFFHAEEDQFYRDFVDSAGFDIGHTTSLDVAAFTVAYQIKLASRRSTLVPYLGAGGGVWLWELEESGDFIDFVPVDPEIFSATFKDDGEAFGWFWLAGVEFPFSPRWSLLFEYRSQHVDDELSGDFEGLGDLDLSGSSVTGGFGWRF